MSDGAANVHTMRASLTDLEGKVAELLINLDRLRPQVMTAQRLTEMRTAISANAGFRLKHAELLDMMNVTTKVLYMLQQLEEEI